MATKNGKNGSALGILCTEAEAIGRKGAEGTITNAALAAAKWAEANADEVATDEARKAVAASVAKAYANGRGDMRQSSIDKWANQVAHFMTEKARKVAAKLSKDVRLLSEKMAGEKWRKHSGQDWQEATLKAVRKLNKADKPVVLTEAWVKEAVKKTGTSPRTATKDPVEQAQTAIDDAIKLIAAKLTPTQKAAVLTFEKAFRLDLAAA